MPHPIEPSTLRILKPTGETVGTGFLVSKHLAVTCAHVVKILGAGAGDTIDIRFTGKSAAITARVLPEFWRPDDSIDIAILQVDDVPAGVFPLRMGRAGESRLKNDLYTFGYAIAGDEQGIGGLGTFITLKQEGNFIQFRMHEANHGHSGAPIYDNQRGVVVGMIKKGHTGAGRNAETTFAIPAETIWQVCPQLKPPTPVLPRRNPIVEGVNLLPYDYDQRIQNFLTEYLGTDSHSVPFGGRDEALHMLDTWLAETTPYLLLAAPAGRGKSALLVRWLDSLKARDDLSLAFVPVSIRFGTNMERVFYAALAARLAYLHGDDVPASPETSAAVYRGLVSDYLSKPLANGRTLLVVLDGLDEAADWQAGADFMPNELPAGVRVVVSARFLAGDADSTPWLRRLNWERNGLASAPSLTPLDRAGVADVLFKMGCPLDEISRKVDIMTELYRLSEGDPLLVGLYVGDLWIRGEEVNRLKPEDLAGIQPGYKGYFDRWWDDQKKLWGKDKPWLEKHVRTVRNLLAGALGPLLRDDFQALEPELQSDYIADALEVLQRFIIGDNKTQGYTFSHPKLGQYFWEALTPTEQAQVENRFLAWGEQTLQELFEGKRDPKKKADVPVYVVRNHGAHLARASQPIEKWLHLIHYEQWAQAWFTVEGAYGGYLQDIQRVWVQCDIYNQNTSANKFPYIAEMIRCALIQSSLVSTSNNIHPGLIKILVKHQIWNVSQAISRIRLMTNQSEQAEAVLLIIPYINENNLSLVFEIAQQIKDPSKLANLLTALSKIQPDWCIKALDAIRVIPTESHRAHALIDLIKNCPVYFLDKIEPISPYFEKDWNYAKVLCALAERQPNYIDAAIHAVENIKDAGNRASVMSGYVKTLFPNKFYEIYQSLGNIFHYVTFIMAFERLVAIQPELFNTFIDAVHNIKDKKYRTYKLFDISESRPELIDHAIKSANEIEFERDRIEVLCKHAKYLPDELSESLYELVKKIKHPKERGYLIGLLAEVNPLLIHDAIKSTYQIGDKEDFISTIISIAKYIPELVDYAVSEARKSKNEYMRAAYFRRFLARKPELLQDAIQYARLIRYKRDQAESLYYLLEFAPFLLDEAIQAAREEIQENQYQYLALKRLLKYKPDLLPDVIAAGKRIPNINSRILYMREFANSPSILSDFFTEISKIDPTRSDYFFALKKLADLIPYEQVDMLLSYTKKMNTDWMVAEVLMILGHRFPELSNEAMKHIKNIKDEKYRLVCLCGVAQHLSNEEVTFILEAIKHLQGMQKSDALSRLLERKPEELDKVWLVAKDTTDNQIMEKVLPVVFEKIPLNVAMEKMGNDTRIFYDFYIDHYLYSDNLSKLTDDKLKNFIINVLLYSLKRGRGSLMKVVVRHIESIQKIEGEATTHEIYEAVRDVTTWWP